MNSKFFYFLKNSTPKNVYVKNSTFKDWKQDFVLTVMLQLQ